MKSTKVYRHQILTVNIKPRLFFRSPFLISAEVSFEIAVTKTEYFDGADSALLWLYAIRAKSDISQVSEVGEILIFYIKMFLWPDPHSRQVLPFESIRQ